jgi:hypothetical protein
LIWKLTVLILKCACKFSETFLFKRQKVIPLPLNESLTRWLTLTHRSWWPCCWVSQQGQLLSLWGSCSALSWGHTEALRKGQREALSLPIAADTDLPARPPALMELIDDCSLPGPHERPWSHNNQLSHTQKPGSQGSQS